MITFKGNNLEKFVKENIYNYLYELNIKTDEDLNEGIKKFVNELDKKKYTDHGIWGHNLTMNYKVKPISNNFGFGDSHNLKEEKQFSISFELEEIIKGTRSYKITKMVEEDDINDKRQQKLKDLFDEE